MKSAWVVLAIVFSVIACSSDEARGAGDAAVHAKSDGASGAVSEAGCGSTCADVGGKTGSDAAGGESVDSVDAEPNGGGFGGYSGGIPSDAGGASADAGTEAGGAGGGLRDGGEPGDAGGAGGSSGSSASSAYNPCPANGTPCKILPFGDSITRGVKSSDDAGYRSELFKLIVAANQKVMFIGSLTNGPTQVSGRTFPRMHEGHPGWTIDPGYNTSGNYGGISSLIPSPALTGGPNIILLQIGTNDVFFRDSASMGTRLEALLDKIAQSAPSALIVLAQITPLSSANPALTAYNNKIPGIIQSHAAKGQHLIGVDMSKLPVTDGLSPDGTHPNDHGYAYMAGIWYTAIKNLLPK